jgi:hypothetical protein
MEAVEDFLKERDDVAVDAAKERLLLPRPRRLAPEAPLSIL